MTGLVLSAAYGAMAGTGLTLLVRFLVDRRIKDIQPEEEVPANFQATAEAWISQHKTELAAAVTDFRASQAEGDPELNIVLGRIEHTFKRRVGGI